MRNLHLANTDFEFELAYPDPSLPIEEGWRRYPTCLQLQYLPLLYALSDEAVVVSTPPPDVFKMQWRQGCPLPQFILLDSKERIPNSQCLSWGASQRVLKWAQARDIRYAMPDWRVVQEINSKAFSFLYAPRLPGGALLKDEKDLNQWLNQAEGRRVLKTCFGLSGQGHYLIKPDSGFSSILKFCQKEWAQRRPLIAEPWVDRVFDFSTQWMITPSQEIHLCGSTVFETNPQGVYQATLIGDENVLFGPYHPFLQEHQIQAEQVLRLVAQKGFFGHIGVDAFIYQCPEKGLRLHPIVEINGRQTMSLAALKFQRLWFPGRMLRFSFDKAAHAYPLLPEWIEGKDGTAITFKRQLSYQIL